MYYSKLVKSMIVILGSIEKYLWQGAIRTAIMTGVLISRGNIQYCVVAEMLAVSGQVGRSGGGGTRLPALVSHCSLQQLSTP